MTSAGSAPVFTCTIPVQVVSEANQRECWQARKRRKDGQQSLVMLVLQSKLPHGRDLGAETVHLTRVIATKGRSMDTDNLVGSFKHVQDAVAKWLGVDDGRLRWTYSQRRGNSIAAVEVEVWNF